MFNLFLITNLVSILQLVCRAMVFRVFVSVEAAEAKEAC
jgi:hypothetical protein